MKTELTAEVEVVRYAVFAEMAWLERRPELGAICRMARDRGVGDGRIDRDMVVRALPGLTEVGCANVVRWCESLKLCDRSGSLTRLGHEVADRDEAPVPEQGVYDVWAVSHPLLGARMLHIARTASSRDGRFDDVAEIPLEPERGRPFVSVVDGESRFVLRSFPSNHGESGALPRKTTARCRIRWLIDWSQENNELHLEGALDLGQERPSFHHPPERVELDPWNVVDGWASGPLRQHGRWSAEHRQLEVGFPGLSEAAQESFTVDLSLDEVAIPRLGRWRNVQLTGVPIAPRTRDDAARWALARLDRHLEADKTRYTRSEVRRLFCDLSQSTPLARRQPTLPEHDALLARYHDRPEVFWRLAAPVDLAPLPSSPGLLDAMTVTPERDGHEDTDEQASEPASEHEGGGW